MIDINYEVSNLTAATKSVLESRIFIDLDPAISSSYSLSPVVTRAGDFDIEIEFTRLSDTTQVLLGEIGSTSDFIACFAGNSFQLRLNGSSVPAVVFTNADDGKLHKVRYKRIAGSIQTFFDDVLKATDTDTNTFTTDRIGRNVSGLFWDGVIANVKLADISTPSNSTPLIRLNQPTSNTQVVGSTTVTYNNIPTSNRQLYTKQVNGDFLGVEAAINGRFNTDTIWVKEAPWVISGGTARIPTIATVTKKLSQTGAIQSGKHYQTIYDVLDIAGGNFIISLGVGADGIVRTTINNYREIIKSTGTSIELFNSSSILRVTIDNVSVRRILEAA